MNDIGKLWGLRMDLVENHPLLRCNHVLKDCDTTGSQGRELSDARSYHASDSSSKVFKYLVWRFLVTWSGYMVTFCSILSSHTMKTLDSDSSPSLKREFRSSQQVKN